MIGRRQIRVRVRRSRRFRRPASRLVAREPPSLQRSEPAGPPGDGVLTVLPKAILFDLDDTLISAYNRPDLAWHSIAHEFGDDLHPCVPAEVAVAINHASDVFWSDAERHRIGRLQLIDARTTIVADAFQALARAGHATPG